METNLESGSNKPTNGVPLTSASRASGGKHKRKPRHNGAHKPRLKTLLDIDQRCSGALRAKKLVADLMSDLQSDLGGAGNITTAKRELCKHAALLSAVCEDFEVAWLQRVPPPMEMGSYLQALNVQRRLLVTLFEPGSKLDRIARPVDDLDKAFEAELARLDEADEASP